MCDTRRVQPSEFPEPHSPSPEHFAATVSEAAAGLAGSIHIRSPYITCEDSSKTLAYTIGVTYNKYIEWIRKSMFRATKANYIRVTEEQAVMRSYGDHYDVLLGRSEYEYVMEAEGRFVKRRVTQEKAKKRPVWRLPESLKTEPIEGFFNDIPSEPAVTVQMQNKTEPYAAGFISSSRLDEAEFTLHAVNHTVAEKLTLDNGDPAPKLGYAYGTFTSGDGQLRARELRLIVVNATTVNVQAIQWLHDILDNVNAFKG